MIARISKKKLIELSNSFRSVAVTGPRQSGKTTLVKEVFPNKPYISLENPDTRFIAEEDPRAFLEQYANTGAILDEVQLTPHIFSYLQEILDNTNQTGLFILTGSNNFLLQQNISQSLAGRIAFLNLLPLSIAELKADNKLIEDDDELMFSGFFPELYKNKNLLISDWTQNYIRTYVERDVRQIKNIVNLSVFERFLRILAGRIGQELNLSSIGMEVGVDSKTAQSWIGILESSYIIFLLRPYFKNYNKTIVKRPKLYFYDTSLVCSLLGITHKSMLFSYPLRGAIFETMVVSEMMKNRHNKGKTPDRLYYWRDKRGNEIDLIVDNVTSQLPLEIKSGKTFTSQMQKNLQYWEKISGDEESFLLYGGNIERIKSGGMSIVNWRNYIINET